MQIQFTDWQRIYNRMPAELRAYVGKGVWLPVSIGASDAFVFRIADSFLKVTRRGADIRLWEEKERLHWLAGRLPVPQVIYYGSDREFEYLYSTRVPGIMACEKFIGSDVHVFADDMPGLVRLLAQGLHMVHAVSIDDCPFDGRLESRLAILEQRVRVELVSEEKYAALLEMRPTEEDLVFTHGDYCMPNVLIDRERGQVSGFIDLGAAGVADRYQDLALACWSLGYNFGPGWEDLFLQEYGMSEPDRQKLEFYRQLDWLS